MKLQLLANQYVIRFRSPPAWVWWVIAVIVATFALGALFAFWLARPRHERK